MSDDSGAEHLTIRQGVDYALRLMPEVLIDSHGQSSAALALKLLGNPIWISYVHYPCISSDMLQRVIEQRPQYNNGKFISSHRTLSASKVLYYKALFTVYWNFGRLHRLVLCNSS